MEKENHTAPEFTREPEDREEEEPTRAAMDSELKTMSAIIRTLDKQAPEARSRIVAYISSRYVRE